MTRFTSSNPPTACLARDLCDGASHAHSDKRPSLSSSLHRSGNWNWVSVWPRASVCLCVCERVSASEALWKDGRAPLFGRSVDGRENTAQPSRCFWRCSPAASGARSRAANSATSSWSWPTTRMPCWVAWWVALPAEKQQTSSWRRSQTGLPAGDRCGFYSTSLYSKLGGKMWLMDTIYIITTGRTLAMSE